MKRKIAVIGAGHVGASLAQYLAEDELGDVALVDIVDGLAEGKALDLTEAAPMRGYNTTVTGSSDFSIIEGSHVIAVTAGIARTPGMTREDLLNTNAKIIGQVTESIVKYAPEAFVIIVSNPLDIMTYHAFKKSGLPKNQVFGQAGVLDSIRFRAFIGMELGVAYADTQAMVMGGHGDTMVPLPRYTTVSGVGLQELLSKERIDALVDRTRGGGGEIVKLLKTGSAYYAPAAATASMVKAVVNDEKKMLAASAYLEGEYGIEDLCIGVPVVIGGGGLEKVIELELTEEETQMLHHSAKTYREFLGIIGY
jgi:malate dehydrogenase